MSKNYKIISVFFKRTKSSNFQVLLRHDDLMSLKKSPNLVMQPLSSLSIESWLYASCWIVSIPHNPFIVVSSILSTQVTFCRPVNQNKDADLSFSLFLYCLFCLSVSVRPFTYTEYVFLITNEKRYYIASGQLSSRHPIIHTYMLHLLCLISRNQTSDLLPSLQFRNI